MRGTIPERPGKNDRDDMGIQQPSWHRFLRVEMATACKKQHHNNRQAFQTIVAVATRHAGDAILRRKWTAEARLVVLTLPVTVLELPYRASLSCHHKIIDHKACHRPNNG